MVFTQRVTPLLLSNYITSHTYKTLMITSWRRNSRKKKLSEGIETFCFHLFLIVHKNRLIHMLHIYMIDIAGPSFGFSPPHIKNHRFTCDDKRWRKQPVLAWLLASKQETAFLHSCSLPWIHFCIPCNTTCLTTWASIWSSASLVSCEINKFITDHWLLDLRNLLQIWNLTCNLCCVLICAACYCVREIARACIICFCVKICSR